MEGKLELWRGYLAWTARELCYVMPRLKAQAQLQVYTTEPHASFTFCAQAAVRLLLKRSLLERHSIGALFAFVGICLQLEACDLEHTAIRLPHVPRKRVTQIIMTR
jgi:hypothetical protein